MARSVEEAIQVAASIHYPVMVRPSYVLGGRSMQIVYDETGLLRYMGSAVASPNHPVLIDKILKMRLKSMADAISDGQRVVVAGIMEHIEEAGVHSRRLSVFASSVYLGCDRDRTGRQDMSAGARTQRRGTNECSLPVKDGIIYVLK